jgi:imidazolonepropionase-like amidohydrolase
MEELRALQETRTLTPAEAESLRYFEWKQEGQLYGTGKLYEMGARRFIMGTDAIQEFGDYALGLALMVQAGLSPHDALMAATANCAEAMGIADQVGTLRADKLADVTIVAGNPMDTIGDVGNVLQVVKAGYALPMDAGALFPHGPGVAVPPARSRRPFPEIVHADALAPWSAAN